MPRTLDLRCVLVLLGVCLLVWAPRLQGPIDLRYDAGVYYLTGTALAQGKGYRLLNEPGEIQAVQYPPLLAALVAAHQWILGTSDPAVVGRWLRWSFFLLYLVYILAAYAMARLYLTERLAFLTGLITALFPHNLFLTDLLFAEIPFALATVLFVLLNRKSAHPAGFFGAALAGAAAFLLRTAGVALLAAWVAEGLLQRRWKQAALRAAVSLLPVAGWQAYLSHVTSSEEYRNPAYPYQRAAYLYYNVTYAENTALIDPFTPERGWASSEDWGRRVLGNLATIPASLGDGVTAGGKAWRMAPAFIQRETGVALPPWLAAIPLVLVGGLVVVGAGVLLVRRQWLIPVYLAVSVGLMCLTPWPGQFTRYMTPLTPFLALCLVQALAALRAWGLSRWSVKWQKAGWLVFALVVFGVLGTQLAVGLVAYVIRHREGRPYGEAGGGSEGRRFYYGPTWENFDRSLAWLGEQAEPNSIVASTAPQQVYLKTGRKAVMPPMEPDTAEAQRLLDSVPVKYVIVDELEFLDVVRRYTEPVIQAYPERWQLAYSPPGSKTRIYRRVE